MIKNSLKLILYFLATFLLLGLLGLTLLAWQPAWQKKLLLKVCHFYGQPVQVDSLDVGFKQVHIQGLYWMSPQGGIAFQDLTLSIDPSQSFKKRQLYIENLQINQLQVDLATVKPDKTQASAQRKDDEPSIEIELDNLAYIYVQAAQINGRIDLEADQAVIFVAQAQQVSAHSNGLFTLDGRLEKDGRIWFAFDADAHFKPEAAKPLQIHTQLACSFFGDAQQPLYRATLESMGALTSDHLELQTLHIDVDTPDQESVVAIHLEQPVNLNFEAPADFIDALTGPVLTLQTDEVPLDWLNPFLQPYQLSGFLEPSHIALGCGPMMLHVQTIGPVRMRALKLQNGVINEPIDVAFDMQVGIPVQETRDRITWNNQLALETFGLQLLHPDGQPLALLALNKPLMLALNAPFAGILEQQPNAFTISVHDWPLDHFSIPNWKLQGTVNLPTAEMKIDTGTFVFNTPEPFSFKQLRIAHNERVLLDQADGALEATLKIDSEATQIQIRDLACYDGLEDQPWFAGTLSASHNPKDTCCWGITHASVMASFDYQKLINHLGLKLESPLKSGHCLWTLGLAQDAQQVASFESTLQINDWQKEGQPHKINQLLIDTQGELASSNRFQGHTQIKWIAHQTSDLDIKTYYEPHKLQLDLHSQQLHIDDLLWMKDAIPQRLTLAQSADAPSSQQARGWPVLPSTQVKISMDKVTQQQYPIANNVQGRLSIDAAALTLESLIGNVYDAPLKVQGAIRYSDKGGYQAQAQGQLKALNIEKFFLYNGFKGPSPVQGFFDVNIRLNSQSQVLDDLIASTQGEVQFSSQDGVFHVGSAASPNMQLGAMAVGIAGSLLSGSPNAQPLQLTQRLIELIQKINYSNCFIEVQRDEKLDMKLTQLRVQSPELMIRAEGQIAHQADVPIMDQALTLKATMGSLFDAAELFDQLGLLQGGRDRDGYFKGPSFTIRGTLARPDFSDLYGLIGKAATHIVLPAESSSSGGSKDSLKDTFKSIKKNIKDLF